MCVLNVHHHMFRSIDLFFHRNAEIPFEHRADPFRKRAALNQLAGIGISRIADAAIASNQERCARRIHALKQTSPPSNRGLRSKASAVRPKTSPSLTANVMWSCLPSLFLPIS